MVTADAMHTQTGTAQWITRRGGHYLLTPLGNQKTLRKTLKALPWKSVPSVSSVDTGHGRRVRRTAKAIEAPAWVDFPGAAQVVQLRRTRTIKSRKHVEVVYLICFLPMTDAQPKVVAAWIQGHWGIENRLHWVRDVVFDEDRHQLRTGNGPKVMATLRNLAISLIRLFHGTATSIASTTRSLSRQPKRAIRLLTQTPRLNRLCRPPGSQGATLVGMDTWVWATGDTPTSVSATASVGSNSATVTASSAGLQLSAPDGKASCTGFGIAWQAGMPEGSSPCTISFNRSSAHLGGTTPLTIKVAYSASYTGSDGSSGTLPAITTTNTVNLPVAEVQTLTTNNNNPRQN